jgi:hypothetical protein
VNFVGSHGLGLSQAKSWQTRKWRWKIHNVSRAISCLTWKAALLNAVKITRRRHASRKNNGLLQLLDGAER